MEAVMVRQRPLMTVPGTQTAPSRPAPAPSRRRPAFLCRAQQRPDEAEPERPWYPASSDDLPSSSSGNGIPPLSSSAADEQQQGQQPAWGLASEPPLAFSPDPDTPPVLIQDWRAFRARLVAKEAGQAARAAALALGTEERWAHVISQPERGCLLVARPRSGLGMFTNTVILLLEHDDAGGSSGLVLNMPTPLLIANLGLEEDIADAFRHCPLFIGGPVNKNLLHVVHGRRDVEGALEIIEGVFAGGVESASELVRRGEAAPTDFMLLAGYSGWGPWQLQAELRAGTWLPVAASQAVIMDVLRESLSWNPNPSGVPSRLGAAGTGAAGATGSLGQSTDDVKRLCWQRVLHRAGISPHMLGML